MLATIPANATESDLAKIADSDHWTVVELRERPSPDLLAAVDRMIFQRRPDMALDISRRGRRFWDLSILRDLPSLPRLMLENTFEPLPDDLKWVGTLTHLDWLTLSLERLPDPWFFEQLPPTLHCLGLGETLRPKGSLAFLRRFRSLERLGIKGPLRDPEVIGDVPSLKALDLESVTLQSLAPIGELSELLQFRLALGATPTLDGIQSLQKLQYLEIWLVRGLASVEPIAALGSLRRLFLQALRNVTAFPSCASMVSLRKVHLDTMKGLRDFAGLAEAPNLERFSFVAAGQLEPRRLAPLLAHPRLKLLAVDFRSAECRQAFAATVRAHGKNPELKAVGEAEASDPVLASLEPAGGARVRL